MKNLIFIVCFNFAFMLSQDLIAPIRKLINNEMQNCSRKNRETINFSKRPNPAIHFQSFKNRNPNNRNYSFEELNSLSFEELIYRHAEIKFKLKHCIKSLFFVNFKGFKSIEPTQ